MTFLAVLFLIAISVWFVPALERARLPLLGAIVLVVGTVFGPAFFAIQGPMQISIDRVLFVILCLVAFFSLRGSTVRIPNLVTADWIVAAYVIWVAVSALRGEPPHGTSPIGTWIFYVLMPAMMYGIVRLAKLRDLDLCRLETAFIGIGIYLSVTAVLESRGFYAFVYPRFIADPTQWEFLGRGRGPLLNPSANGIVLTLALVAAAVRWLRADKRGRLYYALTMLVIVAGVYSTLTRSVWIGAVLALAIVFWNVTPRWMKALSLAGSILLAGLLVSGLKDQLLRMKRDKNLSAAEAEKSVQLRPLLAVVAWEMVKDAPVQGHGFGHYFPSAKPYYSDRSYGLPLEIARGYNQHNVLLSIAVDCGLVGLVMFVALIGHWIQAGWRLSLATTSIPQRHMGLVVVGAIAGYLVGGMFQDVTIMPMINMYLFFLGGLVTSLHQSIEEPSMRRCDARQHSGRELALA